ncbi:MAG TPA: hypothetical protein VKE22_09155 [Haliangiales bacterium]|nr:hypothetical protein [Haliangiales bacterium]
MPRLVVVVAVAALAARAWSQTATEPPSDGVDEGRTLRTIGATSMGVGVALGLATAALLVYAKDAKDSIEAKSRNMAEWTVPDNQLWDKADRADKLGKITAIAAGATFVTGAVLYFIGLRGDERAPQVSVTPVPGGAAMGVTCEF